MAPDVLKGKYTKQADLWSIGVIAYMLMSSQMPFYGRTRDDIVEKIMEGYVVVVVDDVVVLYARNRNISHVSIIDLISLFASSSLTAVNMNIKVDVGSVYLRRGRPSLMIC
jgi:serine/threonine protein kinase